MPRGAKPKVYDDALVERVRELYGRGLTQSEVAEQVGVTQKVVWRLMRRHGIAARVAAKRDQRGPNNVMWRGDSATYTALHTRVYVARGTPSECARCGTSDPVLTYDWANLSGRYEDIHDYERMCRSCHRLYDRSRGGDA